MKSLFTKALAAAAITISIAMPVDASSVTYTYDALGRIKTATYDDGAGHTYSISYTYDAVGNRTQVVTNGAGSAPSGNKWGAFNWGPPNNW